MKPASAPAAVAAIGDEGIEPLGIHRNVLCRLFYRQTCGTSPEVRLVRLELTRPKAHALNVVRHTKIAPQSRSCSCGTSADPIRTDKREGLSLAALPVSVTAPKCLGQWLQLQTRMFEIRGSLMAYLGKVPPEGFAPSPFHGLNVTTLLSWSTGA
jgi:hypothetical protein